MGGKGEMTKTPDDLQDLRRKIYAKAKAEPHWRFWGLYVHVCKLETLRVAYEMAKSNDGAPGSDGVTFEAIEEHGVESFLEQIRGELIERSYVPLRARKKEIPKGGSTKVRTPGKWRSPDRHFWHGNQGEAEWGEFRRSGPVKAHHRPSCTQINRHRSHVRKLFRYFLRLYGSCS
jgi:hypothetical protein